MTDIKAVTDKLNFTDEGAYVDGTWVKDLRYHEDDVNELISSLLTQIETLKKQPKLKVVLTSFPESNGKNNWTAMFKRVDPIKGLVGSSGGITIARGEFWNRVAFEAERAKFLLGERDTEPFILDYGTDIKTPEEWEGEGAFDRRNK